VRIVEGDVNETIGADRDLTDTPEIVDKFFAFLEHTVFHSDAVHVLSRKSSS
jgi:hypothetical protein